MKKPEGVFGTGVSLSELEIVAAEKIGNKFGGKCQYIHFLLQMAVEKLHCIESATAQYPEVVEILHRAEWPRDER